MKQYFLMLLVVMLLSGCATTKVDPNAFTRRDWAWQGIGKVEYSIPEFNGPVPGEFPYKSLGMVEGKKDKSNFLAQKGVVVEMREAEQNCIENAIELGANAILNMGWANGKLDHDCTTTGEAVVFDRVPTKEEVEVYEFKRKQQEEADGVIK